MPKVKDGVVKRGSTWSYVIRVTDPATGRSKPKWVGGHPTQDAAKAARDEARRKARRGGYVDRSAITVAEFLAEWLDGLEGTIKTSTLAGYRADVTRYIVPRIGGQRLQGLRPGGISKLYVVLAREGGRKGRPLAPNTIWHIHRTLRVALQAAVDVEQLLDSNPAARARLPRVERAEPGTVWDARQLALFLAQAAKHRLAALFHLAAFTGARRGELLYLRWTAVDLKAAEVKFEGATALVDGKRIEGSTKSDRSRTVSIDAGTVAVLKAHRKRQAAERLAAGEHWTDHGLVFTTETGDAVYPSTVSALMRKLIKDYNNPYIPGCGRGHKSKRLPPPAEALPAAHFHELRHAHATLLLLAGVPVHVVAARLGHSKPSITLDVYSHIIHDQAAGVADTFAGVLEAGVSKSVSKAADGEGVTPSQ